ncbi:MAG: hypothetical protein WA160_09350 [Pseudobdellovibrio sp.]
MKIVFVAFIMTVSGCATYQSRVTPARDLLAAGQCDASLKLFEELSVKVDGDQLVHLMDYGSALQICGNYKKSNEILAQAENLSEQVDYQSASRVVGATLLNEEMIQYKGDTFEKLFLNAMSALNYIQIGEMDNALVEVRKMNQKFNKLQAEDKKNFELNPFAKYLSGLIWEADKKYDDACIDFRDAYLLDISYRKVALDVLRSCWKAKRTTEFDEIVKKASASADEIKIAKQNNKSEVVIIFMQGWGPRKQPRPDNHYFPHLVSVSSATQFLRVDILDNTKKSVLETYQSEQIYSVEKAAIATLEADYGSLVARRVGARVAKEVMADQIRQKDKLLGNIAWLAMVASERADLRQWSVFPKTIQVIRIPVNPGSQVIRFTGLNYNLSESEKMADLEINIRLGEKKFQLVRSLR